MSSYHKTAAASEIAAAFCALPIGITVVDVAPAQQTRMGTGLSNVVFGLGHLPRGIPL